MKTSRRGYLMAMLSGLAIIGGSSVGVSIAQSNQLAATAAGGEPPVAATATSSTGTAPDPSTGASPTGASQIGPSPTGASANGSSSAAEPSGDRSSASRSTAVGKSTGTSPVPANSRTRPPATRSTGSSGPRSTAASSSAPPPAPSTSAAAGKFKDGSYSAVGSYNSPGGTQEIGVTLTLAADKVTAASVDLKAQGLASTYQKLFASGYLPEVVGKDISSISLGAVAGSSLTGGGFNAAVDQIEDQARA